MATKDWKKEKTHKNYIKFSKGSKDLWISLRNGVGPSYEVNLVDWANESSTRTKRIGEFKKYFKTKSKALVYAKAYMRKH